MSKIDPNQPAFPSTEQGGTTFNSDPTVCCTAVFRPTVVHPGLSIRAYFAGLAMASIVGCFRNNMRGHDDAERESDSDIISFDRSMAIDGGAGAEEIATDAVILADALISALNAQPGGDGA